MRLVVRSGIIAIMGEYQPVARRPIAGVFRRTAGLAVRVCVAWGVHPDVISYLSMVAAPRRAIVSGFRGAGGSGVGLRAAVLLGAVVAEHAGRDGGAGVGRASLRGEIVNELPDRVSDILSSSQWRTAGGRIRSWRIGRRSWR